MQDNKQTYFKRLLLYIGQGVTLAIMFITLVAYTHLVHVKSSYADQQLSPPVKVAKTIQLTTKNTGGVK